MKICVCRNVSDRVIRDHARAGASLEDVLRATGAGSGCGQCVLAVARLHAAEAAVAAERAAANGIERPAASGSPSLTAA